MAVNTPPDTREAILTAVEQLLESRRLDELTVVDLIQAAGISRATFYLYFESKHAAVAARAEGIMEQIYEVWATWLDQPGPGSPGILQHVWGDSIALWRQHRTLLMAASEAWRTDAGVSESWVRLMARYTRTVQRHLERAQAAATVPSSPDARVMATLLVWLNESAMYLCFSSPGPVIATDAQLAHALSAIWLRALHGSPTEFSRSVGLTAPHPSESPEATTPRATRPRRRGNPEVRRAILDATGDLLRERAVESLTALDIAERAQVSRPTFYMYFESKHGAVAEIADEVLGRVYDGWWRGAFEGDPTLGPPGTSEHWRATVAAWRRDRAVLVAASEGWRRDPVVYARWGARMHGFVGVLAAYINHAHDIGTDQSQPDSMTLAAILMWHAETIFYLVFAGLAPELDDDAVLAAGLSAVWLRAVHGGPH